MRRSILALAVLVVGAGGWLLARPDPTGGDPVPSVVVTTTLLESAVSEIVDPTEIHIVRLVPPGTCPGHFDLSPRRLPDITEASLVLRHPFQEPLARDMERFGVDPGFIVVAGSEGSLLLPERYLKLVETVAGHLAGVGALETSVLERRAAAVGARLEKLEAEMESRSASWADIPVVVSLHQVDFCERLGFRVIGTLSRAEDTDPRDLERLLGSRPVLVVANLQEGTRAASVIADRLDVPMAVLSSFPGTEGWPAGYIGLLRGNVARLEAALEDR